jgi:CelD/BcsL family acetyltransferase involved in cellulose biosynthesis
LPSNNGRSGDGRPGHAALRAELLETYDELERYRDGWDNLAVATGNPECSSHWLLAWWRHVAPPEGELRTVVVLGDGELIGIAPFFAQPARAGFTEYRLVGAGSANRIGPLAWPGREREVAGLVRSLLAAAQPRPRALRFEATTERSPWPPLLRAGWPGAIGSWLFTDVVHPGPTIDLRGRSYEDWFAAKSGNFRQQMRRMRRKLERQGASFRMAGTDELERDLDAFVRLHLARWVPRGGSGTIKRGVQEMLLAAGTELLPRGRFRLWSLDVAGETISSHLFLACGGEVEYFGGGFAQPWADFKPSLLTILVAIDDAFGRGERRVDLGPGGQHYKLRLADGDDPIAWRSLFPRDARYPLTRVQALPEQAWSTARVLGRRLPPERRTRVKRVLRRGG